ncbi:beta-N-acetylhexosaminidase [Tahibacter amnicola]|uniref:beta-N-acetylhexosaminidase n=1 Tax=Tahibacter amnicola TaxID=2976241 RepID=A0ABY6BGU2_9GAMM|nr:family 20 glycosylhydrolase [Tahibacter amnicola]UXI68979.1 family 20 glycosylhydrolase [Tahibacter amnicola]
MRWCTRIPLVMLSVAVAPATLEAAPPVIPAPQVMVQGKGHFHLAEGAAVCAAAGESAAAHYFADLVQRTRHLSISVDNVGKPGCLNFDIDPMAPVEHAEGYSIQVEPDKARVRARTPQGLFYGAVTLWQLATRSAGGGLDFPAVSIDDQPRYVWRGLMLDSARHYQSPEFIKRLIDAMALHKLNTLHWHLSDDQGWRIEIKKYPRLTDIGAWRVPAGAAPAADIDPATRKPRLHGGYYTQDTVRDIVRYAAERHITIVPEIDMPGHAQAAIAAYPKLGTGDTPVVSPDWGVHTYLLNVDDETFAFFQDVMDEILELFPGKYIHIGGDEAAKDRWKTSESVQARRRALGIADETRLQAWFTKRWEQWLSAKGRRLIGWDEILEGGLPEGASVMSWRGTQGAIEAAKEGHDVVLSPAPELYLDNLQSNSDAEPSGRTAYVTLQQLYGFEPTPSELTAEQARHVLGAQANVWTEHMRLAERVEHAVFPRIAALAEVTWSSRDRRDWSGFVARLPAQLERYRQLGIRYADSAFAVRVNPEYVAGAATARLSLASQVDAGEIRYTLDGSTPTATASRYGEPLTVKTGTTLRANRFLDDTALAGETRYTADAATLLSRGSATLAPCRENSLLLRLEDDAPLKGERPVYTVDIFDACWKWPSAPLAGVGAIDVSVANLPFNFQLLQDIKHVVVRPTKDPAGELQVFRGACDGKPWRSVSLGEAAKSFERTTVRVAIDGADAPADLCLRFARPDSTVLWAVDRVQLIPAAR